MTTAFQIKATLAYIDEYKRLYIIVEDDESKRQLREHHEDGKHPIRDIIDYRTRQPTGDLKVKLNLIKYEKPKISKYEKLLQTKLLLTILPNRYNNEKFGKGLSLTLQNYYQIPQSQNNTDDATKSISDDGQ